MFFFHPMWDNESQRIGMKKCMPLGYSIHGIGELFGFLGLLSLLGAVGCMIYLAVTGSFTASIWWLLAIPFGMGIVSEFMVQLSWYMVSKRGFDYDYEKREASWIKNGQRVHYKYVQGNAAGRANIRP